MNPERWRRVDAVFQEAVDLAGADRAAFLDAACAGDDDLRREVELLLSADDDAGAFLESPAVKAAAGLLAGGDGDAVGKTFGARYRVVGRIGAGGMGEVYRAEDLSLGRTVALKLLPASLTADGRLRARFLREAKLASALDHPNVCAILDVGRSEDQLYIAMQYVGGPTVKRLAAEGPLEPGRLLAIAAGAADAVAAAHRLGIIHRDVKSSNIVVGADGRAVVLDFGLAKLMDGQSSGSALTRSGTVLGTPGYMAPEQALGEAADPRSDVFSLGVVIYEMATGRLPFERGSDVATLTALVRDPHVPASSLNPGMPAGLSEVIDRALAKDPADRYQSMDAMLGALRGCRAA